MHSPGEQTLVPTQGDIVTAQVVIITQQMCKCLIKCIGNTILSRRYRGILRKEDIRAADKDRIDVYKSFRPGDVILARIVSFLSLSKIVLTFYYITYFLNFIQLPIIEAQTYKLSTAENELGVVTAYSEHGYPMVPISWTMMQCTKMYSKEHRKVAKITPEKMNFKDLKLS